MKHRAARFLASVCLLALAIAAVGAKRPVTIKDFDSWRSLQNQQLSDDGKWLVYASFPEEGDGELIIRNLANGAEQYVPAGVRPPTPPPNYASPNPEERPEPRGLTIQFTPDSRYLVSTSFASKADIEQARKEKRANSAMSKGGLIIIDLAADAVARLPNIRSFGLAEQSSEYLAYLAEPPPSQAEPTPSTQSRRPAVRPEFGSPLVLRKLSDGSERTFPDVTEFLFTKDGKQLVYTVSARNQDSNGVFALDLGTAAKPRTVLSGKGKYTRLAFDDKQERLALLSDRDEKNRFKLYLWNRKSENAEELIAATTDMPFSDKAPIAFSKDGSRLFAGTAPARKTFEETESNTPAEERVSVDLWHWKDDRIQPMQMVRASTERDRSYRAVYVFKDRRLIQLADEHMPEFIAGDSGEWALGSDDREYRPLAEYGERYSDGYLVNTATGERKLVAKRHIGALSLSPDARFSLYFDGVDWNTISIPEGRLVNLTATLPVKFSREDRDTPGNPASWGNAGWAKSGREVLLNDQYDIWQVKPDGSGAANLTAGYGRKHHLQLRYVKLDPKEKSIDPAKPLLLRAEDQENYDTGFFITRLNSRDEPRQLIRSTKTLGAPIKAKNADVLALTISTFEEFPDLYITNSEFRDFTRVTDANPQKKDLLWGTSELISFRNSDGVPLKAAVYKPENFSPAKKYPMIVYIYERLSQNVKHFADPRPSNSINIAHYVSNGYVVVEPDIVYTTGYPGPSAIQCVLPAVQAVVDKGYIDENAIGIQGHSWGGYQIAYMITQTNRFKAAAAGAVVANMTSAYNGIRWGPGLPRQFQYEKQQSRIGGSLWEYPMRFILNSPIFQADRIRTPLLMMHNDADDAVPWYQGIEFYLSLRRLGKEVYMFNYNGEPHNLRRRANQKDYTLRMQQFFDHYLKGAPEPEWMKRGIPYLEKGTERSAASGTP